jgi:hypothetical protein
MQRSIVYFTFFVLFIARAIAQSTVPGAIYSPLPVPSGNSPTTITSLSDAQPVGLSLTMFASQREQQAARVTALRKDIAALEARLVDPRSALRDAIEAMTRIETEMISAFVTAPGDTELAHSIEPFVSDLVRMRNIRIRQLSAAGASDPAEAEKIRRQWLNKQDELRAAEMLIAGIEKQLDALRADRELDRRALDLTGLTKTIPAPGATTLTSAGESATRPISKP